MASEFKFEIYKTAKGHRTRIRHRNTKIVLNGGQSYSRMIDASRMIDNLIFSIKTDNFERTDKPKETSDYEQGGEGPG